MADQHQFAAEGLTSPADNGTVITPSDSTDLAYVSRAIVLGTAGALKVTFLGGNVTTLPAQAAGYLWPIRVSRVWATGTTATDIVNLY